MTGILDPPPAEKFGVLHHLSYQATQKEQKGHRSSVETRSPGKSKTSCVETRAVTSPLIQAGDNVSYVFVADNHTAAGISEAVAAKGQAPSVKGPPDRGCRPAWPGAESSVRLSAENNKHSIHSIYKTQRWLSKITEKPVLNYDNEAMYVIA